MEIKIIKGLYLKFNLGYIYIFKSFRFIVDLSIWVFYVKLMKICIKWINNF